MQLKSVSRDACALVTYSQSAAADEAPGNGHPETLSIHHSASNFLRHMCENGLPDCATRFEIQYIE